MQAVQHYQSWLKQNGLNSSRPCSTIIASSQALLSRACSIAVVVYMQWRRTWPFCLSELQILGNSRRVLLQIFISRQDEPMCVPDAYIMSINVTLPRRLFSTTVRRVRRPSSTAVQFPHHLFHDGLQLLAPVVFRIENFTDAHRIDAFVMDHVTDLCGHG